jgi:hypothetical protein
MKLLVNIGALAGVDTSGPLPQGGADGGFPPVA